MSYTNNNQKKTETANQIRPEEINILRAAEIADNVVSFNIEVRGITIYSMILKKIKTADGDTDIINFPSVKGKDGKYYKEVYFPIDQALKESIINKVTGLL